MTVRVHPLQPLLPFQRRLRHLTWIVALGALFYLGWRYEMLTLPREGCSPLARFRPGQTLLTDRHPSEVGIGDAILFHEGGRVLLAEVRRLRGDQELPATGGSRQRLDFVRELWLETDVPSCPGEGSPELGWIPTEDLSARVLLVWPW
jgi:hypothetical protein